ncbi:hypothetical protein [Sphingomonas sp. R1]|uniref:hypothetical protein n=1 Tax=Sphingomonas sp. R1 TaxID=399176 RepID=UPI0022250059|nr:hypothetical protein [Sphingomonas sp. R1]UYY76806.1 hypothetical protein OIM94_15030 [Sphingomonas sp. R1]
MSTLSFHVDEWLQSDDPDPRRAGTLASVVIKVGDMPATRLFDDWSKTVTDRARLPLYSLAEWFAANWWRLHHEVAHESLSGFPPVDWRLSHDLASVGGGYIWPRMRFVWDDLTMQVSARALRNAAWEPVRHLNDIATTSLSIAIFDAAVERLINLVLERLRALGVCAEPLATIWSDVIEERNDLEVADWRAWEARLGYDAGEAPEKLMEQIASLFGKAGRAALAEIAPVVEPQADITLDSLMAIANTPGISATLPLTGFASSERSLYFSGKMTPWDAGRAAARKLRDDHGPATGPMEDRKLLEFLGIGSAGLNRVATSHDLPIGLGVRLERHERSNLHFRRRSPEAIRFEAARFVAESMIASESDHYLPLTDLATARQKFQRAFAAELLAPIEEIIDLVGPARSTDAVEAVGAIYRVSSLAIFNHLENHRRMSLQETNA